MNSNYEKSADDEIRRYLKLSAATVFAFLIGVGAWAYTSELTSAVIASGSVTVAGHVKRIQHSQGGTVRSILVRDGSKVRAGDQLIQLDDTLAQTSLSAVVGELDQLDCRKLRLIAERDGLTEMTVASALVRLDDVQFAEHYRAELALFLARKEAMQTKKRQFDEQIRQVRQQSQGIAARLLANEEELAWVSQQRDRMEGLSKEGLVQFSRLAEVQRAKAQLDGERGQITSDSAVVDTKIAEIEAQIMQLDRDRHAEVLAELVEVNGQLAKLRKQKAGIDDEIQRARIMSPVGGIVHELALHTVGGVLGPGETAMEIVPDDDVLLVDAKVIPTDIDRVSIGQAASLRLTGFNQRTTPELQGILVEVSPDVSFNQQSGESWYSARIEIDKAAVAAAPKLVPGMPVEVLIATGKRTALSYLVKPFADQVTLAFREN